MSELIVFAGPNGAGKTTAALTMLSRFLNILEFVNADEIARGLSPLRPANAERQAARLMLSRIVDLINDNQNFAIETTCAGRTYLALLDRARRKGFRITIVFLWLPSVQAALARVRRRVRQGGHDVPTAAVKRRYKTGWQNFRGHYLTLADNALIYDNSDRAGILVAEKRDGGDLLVHDPTRWKKIERTAG
jgi:predicted ABC-type ATPase